MKWVTKKTHHLSNTIAYIFFVNNQSPIKLFKDAKINDTQFVLKNVEFWLLTKSYRQLYIFESWCVLLVTPMKNRSKFLSVHCSLFLK